MLSLPRPDHRDGASEAYRPAARSRPGPCSSARLAFVRDPAASSRRGTVQGHPACAEVGAESLNPAPVQLGCPVLLQGGDCRGVLSKDLVPRCGEADATCLSHLGTAARLPRLPRQAAAIRSPRSLPKITVKGARCAPGKTPDCDLPRQNPAPIRRMGPGQDRCQARQREGLTTKSDRT